MLDAPTLKGINQTQARQLRRQAEGTVESGDTRMYSPHQVHDVIDHIIYEDRFDLRSKEVRMIQKELLELKAVLRDSIRDATIGRVLFVFALYQLPQVLCET